MPANSLQKGLVRMSWGARNLYSLWRLTYDPPAHLTGKLSFKRTSLTLFQQKWVSKRMLRAYHGDWIQERRLRRRFMPDSLPPLEASTSTSGSSAEAGARSASTAPNAQSSDYGSRTRKGSEASSRIPLASLMWREVEARLDVALFRACFVHSAYDARRMITQGHVKLNGKKCTDPNILLQPGDIFSLDPKEMYLLRPSNKPYEDQSKTVKKSSQQEASEEGSESAVEAAPEAETQAAPAESTTEASTSETSSTSETNETASTESSESSTSSEAADKPAVAATDSETTKSATPPKLSKKSSSTKKEKKPVPGLPFELPDFAAPFLFIPAYLEVSFPTCSAIYVRHPTARPGVSEIPTPYDADGEVMRLGWEFYKGVGRRRRGVVDVGDEDVSSAATMKDLYTAEGKRNWTANWEDTQLEKRHMRAVRQGRGRWAHRPL